MSLPGHLTRPNPPVVLTLGRICHSRGNVSSRSPVPPPATAIPNVSRRQRNSLSGRALRQFPGEDMPTPRGTGTVALVSAVVLAVAVNSTADVLAASIAAAGSAATSAAPANRTPAASPAVFAAVAAAALAAAQPARTPAVHSTRISAVASSRRSSAVSTCTSDSIPNPTPPAASGRHRHARPIVVLTPIR